MTTIDTIIINCGGRDAIASLADDLSADAIRKWPSNGIPEKRWDIVMKAHKGRLTAATLHGLNKSIRQTEVSA